MQEFCLVPVGDLEKLLSNCKDEKEMSTEKLLFRNPTVDQNDVIELSEQINRLRREIEKNTI